MGLCAALLGSRRSQGIVGDFALRLGATKSPRISAHSLLWRPFLRGFISPLRPSAKWEALVCPWCHECWVRATLLWGRCWLWSRIALPLTPPVWSSAAVPVLDSTPEAVPGFCDHDAIDPAGKRFLQRQFTGVSSGAETNCPRVYNGRFRTWSHGKPLPSPRTVCSGGMERPEHCRGFRS